MTTTVSKDFVLSRIFDAPRDLVWAAWTDVEHLKKWWGPKGFKVVSAKLDLKPGGTFHYGMQAPDGNMMWGKFIYREIRAPERLVFIVSFSDKDGGVTRHPMAPTWPLETLSTATFADNGGKTEVTVIWAPHNATDEERKTFDSSHDSMRMGWGGTMDQFAAYLAKAKV
jgi:uncharacterized protein YndB with AHSA1/START domain